ncbi:MAG: hypothetical protein M3Z66_06350, partial [Chloroflexota bacterium]|nr:hypothetical protein [Chloroflexota bacterium]
RMYEVVSKDSLAFVNVTGSTPRAPTLNAPAREDNGEDPAAGNSYAEDHGDDVTAAVNGYAEDNGGGVPAAANGYIEGEAVEVELP